MVAHVADHQEGPARTKVATSAIGILGARSDIAGAKRLFDLVATVPDLRLCNAMLFAYSRVGDIDGAFKLLTSMLIRGIQPTDESFHTIMQGALKHSRYDSLERAAGIFETLSVPPTLEVLDLSILGALLVGDIDTAWKRMERRNEVFGRDVAAVSGIFSNAVVRLDRMRKTEFVRGVLKIMRERGLTPSDRATACELALVTRTGDAAKAKAAFEKFRSEGASEQTWVVYHGFLLRHGLASEAAALRESAAQSGIVIKGHSESRGEQGVAETRTPYWKQQAETSDAAASSALLPEPGQVARALSHLWRKGKQSSALVLFERARLHGRVGLREWTAMILGHLWIGDLPGARALVAGMQEAGVAPDAQLLTSMIRFHVKLGAVVEAATFIQVMAKAGLPIPPRLPLTLLDALIRTARFRDASFLVGGMLQAQFRIPADVCAQVLKGLAGKKALTEAGELAAAMHRSGVHLLPSAARAYVDALNEAGHTAEAAYQFERMMEEAAAAERARKGDWEAIPIPGAAEPAPSVEEPSAGSLWSRLTGAS